MDKIKETNCSSVYYPWTITIAVNVKIPPVSSEAPFTVNGGILKNFMKADW